VRSDRGGADDRHPAREGEEDLLVPRRQALVGESAIEQSYHRRTVFAHCPQKVALRGGGQKDRVRFRFVDALQGGTAEDDRYHENPSSRKRGLPSPSPCLMAATARSPGR